MKEQLRFLRKTSAKLTCFLLKTCHTARNDPFLDGINRMKREEKSICRSQASSDFNQRLLVELETTKTRYEEHLNKTNSNNEDMTLSNVYELIKSVSDISMVKVQLDAIRKHQQHLVQKNEHVVDVNKTQTE